jgi:diguanylate cyclase
MPDSIPDRPDEANGGQAQAALKFMLTHSVTPTAAHYEVWLEYAMGRNGALRAAIDARIASGGPVGNEFTEQVGAEFLASASAAALASQKLAEGLQQVLTVLRQAEERSGDYGRTLETAATDLNRGLAPDQLRLVVSSLAAATLDMANHNQQLNDQLKKSTSEIDALRSNLESARVESLTDALTGLSNRRMFDETLRHRIEEARAQKTELFLLLCDVDHFKRFNDTWGHHTGDQILRFLAAAMQAHAKSDFLVARYGGEEFAMIMPRSDAPSAARIAEAMCQAIRTKRLRRRSTNEDLGQVTISIGLARLTAADTPQGLVERADACLYASKRNGRDRVTTDAAPVLYVA